MLALVAVDALERTTAFPRNYVDEGLIERAVDLASNTLPLYEELLVPLMDRGRRDLARAIEHKIGEYQRSEKLRNRRKAFIEPVLQYDRKHLKGTLRAIKRFVYPREAIWKQ
jgi:hypothetical protein